ncbi:activating signal cointegrator 1 complex subunit 3 [Anthonomus grandis grandis]|uniref:activating signal cointegrator 1 complex subunit 3 n=1 Tax=Anthonomus grandis grandis TaxID=2921223 RepID=UPI0021654C31|nr:activating signal cointegrator 1 complex subunit 3 [Anthonomus grandis grandis]
MVADFVVDNSSFFKDFHGLQPVNESEFKEYSAAECEYDRLENHFKYSQDSETGQGLVYLQCLHDEVRKQVRVQHNSETPIDDFVYENVLKILKDYARHRHFNKQYFSKVPARTLKKIEGVVDNIVNKLPNNFFEKHKRSYQTSKTLDLPKTVKELNPIFYIPLKEDLPSFENNKNNSFSLLYTGESQAKSSRSDETYPLETMYEIYRASIPNYSYNEFKSIVEAELISSKSDDEVVAYLLDTFGCTVFDFISEIVRNRHKKIDYGCAEVASVKGSSKLVKKTSDAVIAGTVTVQSEKESNLLKKLRKIEKKDKGKLSHVEIDQTEVEYEVAKNTPLFKKQAVPKFDPEEYPHVHDQMRNHMITTKYDGVSIMQPDNAIKKFGNDYAEFTIPGGKKGDVKDMKLVKVSSLDTIGKLVFKDIEQFNRIQSEVFPVAYNTNENMLVCAPTGAGKTNIALLSIVHQIRCHLDGSLIRKNDFKIIYVCPMKALATEMVANFGKKLAPIGISVKECTGDMQLTKKEIAETQMLVTTPEKWDVITRKGAVDTEVVGLVKLLIIDEVHLLNGSRGPVIEALVARTLRQVVSSQSMIRIVALSATLPGYFDVAQFLKVNPKKGLFFFDNRFRSVPLTTSFIGVKKRNENETMDMVCYEKVVNFIRDGHQAMVFVTARNATATVAKRLIEIAQEKGTLRLFEPDKGVKINRSGYKNSDLGYLVPQGFGIHHAGMVRSDRLEIEHLFRTGELKVIVCTTTLAWGVNLPAHAVIIRGTLHYDATKSTFVDMDMLDVQQIFGRAGRPQYDTSGHGIIITTMANMSKYMGLMLSQVPIESQFLNCVPDNLNAEIVLGTVSNLREAMEWLTNTFLYCRIKKNPLVYGLTFKEVFDPYQFNQFLQNQLDSASGILEKAQMIRFDNTLGELRPTNFGRIASFYYISYKTMELFYEKFDRYISEANLLRLLSEASEFQQIQVRMDEIPELDRLRECNEYEINLDFANVTSKVICLIQANISRAQIRVSSLGSDTQYIMQTIVRLARALFEIAKDRNYALQVSRTLKFAQMLEQQMWDHIHPLMQFKELVPHLSTHRAMEILNLSIEELKEMSERELESLFRARHVANRVRHYCNIFPTVEIDVVVKPITDGVIRVKVLVTPTFKWDNQTHGTVQHYYAWVEDPTHDAIYHIEAFVITKRMCQPEADPIELVFTVPLTKPLSLEYFVKVTNSQFMHSESIYVIDLNDLKLFTSESFQTHILDLQPLPKKVLRNKSYEDLYPFTHLNAVQSQVFHSCFYTDTPIILGAPTGSGKTIVAEFCILRLFTRNPEQKVVYIAPMKALVRERVLDWSQKFAKINKKVIEVTGDVTPRSEFIRSANIIITTPEKWDAMSRNWTEKDFVKQVGLMVIDEIHLLGEDRGPVLEVIVSRMNCINHKKNTNVRIIGLSTAMANPGDLAYWLNCDKRGLFNFSSAVRPVPLEIHLQGFEVKHYCPRMAAMNKSVYQAICQYAPESSALIFVSSRKQTRITGYELMKFLLTESRPQKWMHLEAHELEDAKARLIDQDLSQLLSFGIGMHHAGLCESDRNLVEHLYVNQKIQVLIATSTLAWGVNFPARLVIVKGTEYFDAATKRYVDMPITDVIQMCGRAGRPQFDTSGVACVMVQESKKNFYRKFLFEPFPVESNLLESLPDHVNAEVANGNILSKAQLVEFIESTFFFKRLLANPSYYQMESNQDPIDYISDLADSVIDTLQQHDCIVMPTSDEMKNVYEASFLGMLGCQYYLSYKTMYFLSENMQPNNSVEDLLILICQVEEYRLFPVRHNEDNINKELAKELDVKTNFPFDSPCLKVLLMIKCYLLDCVLPNQEYVLDLKSVLDQIIRIIHAMMNLAAGRNWLDCTLKLAYFSQMLIQGYTIDKSSLIMLPYVNHGNLREIKNKLCRLLGSSDISIPLIKSAMSSDKNISRDFAKIFQDILGSKASGDIMKVINDLPAITIETTVINIGDSSRLEVDVDNSGNINVRGNREGEFLLTIDLMREGSAKMNVYSKKFNKQKEEFWFLVLQMEKEVIFRKFSFTRKNKKIELPVNLRRGFYYYKLHILSDCYIGFDQLLTYRIKIS